MKHLGDITKINGAEVPVVDVICGGSPCQDLSVAGKRAGLSGERSGLFMEQIRIVKEMRENDRRNGSDGRTDERIRPRYMVWENVPGAFSSNKGEDFRAVLEETARIAKEDAVIPGLEGEKWRPAGCIMGDGWSIAWRVHDAQFWGVPQRRKRIALVADFGGTTAPEILFERKGVSGDIEASREPGERVTKDAERGIRETSASGFPLGFRAENTKTYDEKATTVCNGTRPWFTCGVIQGFDAYNQATNGDAGKVIGFHITQDPVSSDELSYACSCGNSKSGQCVNGVVYGIGGYNSKGMLSNNPNSGIYEAETARTLDLNGGSPACNQGGMAVVQGADVYNGELTGEKAATLTAACGGTNTSGAKVVYKKQGHPQNAEQGQGWEETNINDTLNAFDNGESRTPTVILENHPADNRVKICEDGVFQSLTSRMGTGGGNVPMVMETYQETTGSLCASGYDKLGTQEAMNDMFVVEGSSWDGSQTSPTLIANNAGGNQRMSDKDNFNAVVQSMEVFHCTNDEERVQTLKARDYKDPQVVAYGLDRASFNQGENAKFDFSVEEEKIGAQVARGPGAVCSENAVVRRLTPLECERLQGFPDNWTNIGDWVDSKGKTHKGESDSPRYKALGNSIALPFWMWMAERMVNVLKEDGVENPTMASLFDGIGGFPYSYERVGCKAVWASEIEEFPIAVTKIRFPDIDE